MKPDLHHPSLLITLWHRSLVTVLLVLGLVMPSYRAEAGSLYTTGKVKEILAEKVIDEPDIGRHDIKYRFQLEIPAETGSSPTVITLEETYSPEVPKSMYPRPGKQYVLLKEVAADQSASYSIVGVQRSQDTGWALLAIAVLLILIGRWQGLKPLLAGGAAAGIFSLGMWIHLPWLLNVVATVGAGIGMLGLLSVGPNRKLSSVLVSTALSTGLTIVAMGLWGWLMGLGWQDTLGGSAVLELTGASAYLAMTTVVAIATAYRQEPTLKRADLFRSGLQSGRQTLEGIVSVVLFFYLGRMASSAYGSQSWSDWLQTEAVGTDMITLLTVVLGICLCHVVSAWLGAQMLYRRNI